MKWKGLLLGVSMLLFGSNLSAVNAAELQSGESSVTANSSHQTIKKVSQANFLSSNQAQKTIYKTSEKVINALKYNDMERVGKLVHPTKGLRFSPYTYVDVKHDLIFPAKQLRMLSLSNKVYRWGTYDGSGTPIKLTFTQYYRKFVYDRDYARTKHVSYNQVIKTGNTVNNIRSVYPGSIVVEYHVSGTRKYSGMDWSSLRLVYQKKGNHWYLVGIVHDQWTI
ncbi:hypothetical protein [Peribacillus sp. SCS-155]|uniref:hypothetical protein n=1 Tax=Peribacillus sedimenti TaxID=3115297 RepID=UPI0039069AAC